jgi:hypothetical protein
VRNPIILTSVENPRQIVSSLLLAVVMSALSIAILTNLPFWNDDIPNSSFNLNLVGSVWQGVEATQNTSDMWFFAFSSSNLVIQGPNIT